MKDLSNHLAGIARLPVLLVATDYDGTLAPIVEDPGQAEARRESLVALRTLAGLPHTHIAVISGRALADLAKRLPESEKVHLVGSHGSEFEMGFVSPLPPQAADALQRVHEFVQQVGSRAGGSLVEKKPSAIAFHYRNVPEVPAMEAVNEILQTVSQWEGVFVRHGKKVIELSVVQTNKGQALATLRQRLGASAVLFLGDDVTDEDAFAILAGPDIGIKVGEGPSNAKYRVQDTLEVAQVLAQVAELRSAWLAGAEAIPIEHYSFLSDQRTCALVGPQGRISWMCLPRLDSAALFADLLGGEESGYFEICPVEPHGPPRQHYEGNSFLLRTQWDSIGVLDYLDCSAGRPFQRAGRTDLLRVLEGRGRVRIAFAPRLNYGGIETRLRLSEHGVEIDGAVDPCVLYAPGLPWQLIHDETSQTAVAEIELEDTPVVLEMRYGTASIAPSRNSEPRRREQTERFWSNWASTLKLPALYPDLVMRSALVLRALCYGPSGAIAAAATTSLPEHPGGVRNWDYRFCWPRDASMAASSLIRLGATGPALKFLDWMAQILEEAEPGALVRPVYSVTGGHLGAEGVIAELSGYRGSRPVRSGNSAAHQIQLDVLGPVMEMLCLLAQQGASLTPEHYRMIETMVAAVVNRWREEDHGIWEIRGPRKHHVHSKIMCWQTLDYAIRVADYMGRKHEDWQLLKQAIAEDVLSQGWNRQQNTFCSHYGGTDIDAAVLWVGLSGLLPPNDPRFMATVQAVERELLHGPVVYRYRFDDGLPGLEGGFNICTTWLIESYALLGRWHDAEALMAQYVKLAGPTGLMSEEYDPTLGLALGNFPQAYSHVGLINAAVRLSAARSSAI